MNGFIDMYIVVARKKNSSHTKSFITWIESITIHFLKLWYNRGFVWQSLVSDWLWLPRTKYELQRNVSNVLCSVTSWKAHIKRRWCCLCLCQRKICQFVEKFITVGDVQRIKNSRNRNERSAGVNDSFVHFERNIVEFFSRRLAENLSRILYWLELKFIWQFNPLSLY